MLNVDFTGVTSGGSYNVPEGDYVAEVTEIEQKLSKQQKPFIAFTLTLRGDQEGKKLFHNCSLQPQALFNLRRTLEALGFMVPDGQMDIDLNELKGLYMGVHVEGEEYQGKVRPRVTEVFPLTDDNGGEPVAPEDEL
jgi:hypothetical protein